MSARTAVVIENDSQVLKEVSKDLIKRLRTLGVNEETIFDIQVAFEEALRNAMVHGNRSMPNKKVTVETEVEPGYVWISIEDEGEGFDIEKLPDPTHSDNLLKESGRGVYLMRHLMDELKYENKGRKVVMKKFFKK